MYPEIEELVALQRLLAQEKADDMKQYNEQVLKSSLTYRKNTGLSWYPVVINQTEIGLGEYLILELERTNHLNEPHQLGVGKSVALFSNQPENEKNKLHGIVKHVHGNKLKLALTVDELPDWVDDGKLGLDLLFDEGSYREMEIALHQVINAEKGRLAYLRTVLYGNQTAGFDTIDEINYPSLNHSQNEALRKVVSAQDVAIIHGPPGTGKTTTLVQAIKHTVGKEKQVLVCSPSNIAVDLITEKLVKQGLDVIRLGNPARVSDEVVSNTLDTRVTQHPYYKDIKSYVKRSEEFRNMAGKYKRHFGKAEREQRQLMYAEARNLLKEARVLEDYVLDSLFGQAQVITCTPFHAAGRYLKDRFFNTVFIDEAAQALEPMCWIPILKAKRLIMAGDHCQLPPTVKSKEAEGLKETLFEKCIKRQPHVAVMLDEQYRMNEQIMGFSSQQFYNGELKADHTVAHAVLKADAAIPILSQSMEFIDTAGCGYEEKSNPETLSISNPDEAQLLIRHLMLLIEEFTAHVGTPVPSIGIITPYSEQVQYFKEQIEQTPILASYSKRIAVKTVDGFQGQEKDVIYMSMVRSNDRGEIGFLSDTRRMNVALTRAKKKLVVIGDSATLANHPFYQIFLSYVEASGIYKSAWEYVS